MKKVYQKLNELINENERKKIILLTLFLFFGLILEIIALGLLMPTINIFFEKSIYEEYLIRFHIDSLITIKYEEVRYLLLILLGGIYLLKNLFLVYLNYRQNRFVSNLNTRFFNYFFSNYLNQSLIFHSRKEVSVLIKRMQIDISHAIALVLNLISVITEVGLLLSIVITLLIIELKSTIVLFLFFGIILLILYPTYKNKSILYGEKRNLFEEKISKILYEGFNGIKELIIYDKKRIFINQLDHVNDLKARVNTNHTTLSQTPRNLLEILSIIGIILVIILLSSSNSNMYIISKLTVYIAAMFRAIPTLNKILGAIQNINYQSPALDNLINEKKYFSSSIENNIPIEFNNSINLENIDFKFEKKEIFQSLNVEFKIGNTYGIIGPSGTGKTTLINLICGLYKPTSGKIKIDNVELNENNLVSWKSQIGYVSQKVFIFNESLIFNITYKNSLNEEDYERFISALNLSKLAEVFQNKNLDHNYIISENGKDFSGGEIQRIGIARALYRNPKILIFDESTASLDEKTEAVIMNNIYELSNEYTVLIISHKKEILKNCNQIFKLSNKKLENEKFV